MHFTLASPLGGDVEEIGYVHERTIRSLGSNFLASPLGGDVEKISDLAIFKNGKIRSHGSIFWHHLLGAMLRKLAIFDLEKYVRMVAFFRITSWGAMLKHKRFSTTT